MLKSGFHKSFEELFNLIEQRRRERLDTGADSVLWQVLKSFTVEKFVTWFLLKAVAEKTSDKRIFRYTFKMVRFSLAFPPPLSL